MGTRGAGSPVGGCQGGGLDGVPLWKLSQVSLIEDTAMDVRDDDNFGLALEANRQVALA